MNKYAKYIFIGVWAASFFVGLYTIFDNTPLSVISKTPALTANAIQRLTGIFAFIALFYQIILGTYMTKFAEKLGGWIYKFHIYQGIAIYTAVIFHPIFFLIFNRFVGRGVDPFYVFTQICLICQNKGEYYYTFGRISFWLINITVFAGLFRTMNTFMRVHWKKFHILNYLVFLLVGLHGYFVGSDFTSKPFLIMAGIFYVVVVYIILFKKIPHFYGDYKKWLAKN